MMSVALNEYLLSTVVASIFNVYIPPVPKGMKFGENPFDPKPVKKKGKVNPINTEKENGPEPTSEGDFLQIPDTARELSPKSTTPNSPRSANPPLMRKGTFIGGSEDKQETMLTNNLDQYQRFKLRIKEEIKVLMRYVYRQRKIKLAISRQFFRCCRRAHRSQLLNNGNNRVKKSLDVKNLVRLRYQVKSMIHLMLNSQQRFLLKAQRRKAIEVSCSSNTSSCEDSSLEKDNTQKELHLMPIESAVDWKLVKGIMSRTPHKDFDKMMATLKAKDDLMKAQKAQSRAAMAGVTIQD